jgi:hypothetical protein
MVSTANTSSGVGLWRRSRSRRSPILTREDASSILGAAGDSVLLFCVQHTETFLKCCLPMMSTASKSCRCCHFDKLLYLHHRRTAMDPSCVMHWMF